MGQRQRQTFNKTNNNNVDFNNKLKVTRLIRDIGLHDDPTADVTS